MVSAAKALIPPQVSKVMGIKVIPADYKIGCMRRMITLACDDREMVSKDDPMLSILHVCIIMNKQTSDSVVQAYHSTGMWAVVRQPQD